MTAPAQDMETRKNSGRRGRLSVGTKFTATVSVALVALVTAGVARSRLGSLDDKVQNLKEANIARLSSLNEI
ncbi:hypothetical protein [Cryptosporangium sp. NPDC048952]|uniref:hypothetical protein n=1 Tax=Cryptosporangium sp. NPDC048952 TaxID=3363961 RepID=UPI00371BA006